MTRRPPLLRRLLGNKLGTALTEFALIAPVFLLLLMGIFDYCWQMYAQQVLQGAVSQSARLSTLESFSADQKKLDANVLSKVLAVLPNATVEFKRKAYESYDLVGKPEPLTDKNGNGVWDTGECFEDMNGTGSWEADRGVSGNGGADDVVLYVATMKFNRVFPAWRMLGQPQEATLRAQTVLRNQPFGTNTSSREVICNK